MQHFMSIANAFVCHNHNFIDEWRWTIALQY